MFSPTAELVISTGRPTNEENPKVRTQILTAETTIKKIIEVN